jgi:hypothetical protein
MKKLAAPMKSFGNLILMTLICVVIFWVFMALRPAQATYSTCAVVLRTPDGFLNLRKKPMMGSKVLARLKPGQWITIGSESIKEGWTKVESIGDREILGFVGTRFIVRVRCDQLDPTDD